MPTVTPPTEPCTLPGAGVLCKIGDAPIDFATDPLGYFNDHVKRALGSLLSQLGHVVSSTSTPDLTNVGFVRLYAIMFGAATFLTMILWLIAVAKRALAGVPVGAALGEPIGFLLLSVGATMCAPLALVALLRLADGVADAIFAPSAGQAATIGTYVIDAWGAYAAVGGGNLILAIVGPFMLLAVLGIWLELILRGALIFLILLCGPLTFSGLVDRGLWSHTRRWIGVVVALLIAKIVTLATLALAITLLDTSSPAEGVTAKLSRLFLALALFWLTLLAPIVVAYFVPAVGDDLVGLHHARRSAQQGIGSRTPAALSSAGEIAARASMLPSAVGSLAGRGGGAIGQGVTAFRPAARRGVGVAAGALGRAAQAARGLGHRPARRPPANDAKSPTGAPPSGAARSPAATGGSKGTRRIPPRPIGGDPDPTDPPGPSSP